MGKSKKTKRPKKKPNLQLRHKRDLAALVRKTREMGIFDPNDRVLTIKNSKEKMSDILMEFAEPLLKDCDNDQEIEKAISMAVVSWNVALMPKTEQVDARKKILDTLDPGDSAGRQAVMEIVDYLIYRKQTVYASNQRLIVNYKISKPDGEIRLIVASTPSAEMVDRLGASK
jgi:hypothetical protein